MHHAFGSTLKTALETTALLLASTSVRVCEPSVLKV